MSGRHDAAVLRRALTHSAAPVIAAVVLAGLGALLTPPTADLAAQHFRTELWREHGWVAWNLAWYGGHHVPSYSLTFPPLSALVGPRLVGFAGAVLGAAAAARIAPRGPAALLFAVTLSAGVWIGRMPFTLAVGIGAAAVAWPRAAAPLSALATATSPMAGLFLVVLAGVRWWEDRRLAAALALALPAIAVAGTLSALFPDDGAEWFRAGTFWPALALALLATAALPAGILRTGAIAGVALLVGAFVLDTPVGQNAMRYWTLLAPPALAAAAAARPRVLVALAVAWTYLALLPAARAVLEAQGDPSTRAAFHHELADWLDANADPGDRVEVPMTANHWEAAHLALRRNIARGWLRQIDRARNPLFYDGRLDERTYTGWLRAERVRWVAVPRETPLDHAGRAEAALAPRTLRRAARLRNWTVYELPGVEPLAGAGRITAAGPAGLTGTGTGTLSFPYRHSPWLDGSTETPSGRASVRAGGGRPFRLGRPPEYHR